MVTVPNKSTGCGMLIGFMISKLQISNSTVLNSSSPLDILLASCYQNLVAATATRRTISKDPFLARMLPFFESDPALHMQWCCAGSPLL